MQDKRVGREPCPTSEAKPVDEKRPCEQARDKAERPAWGGMAELARVLANLATETELLDDLEALVCEHGFTQAHGRKSSKVVPAHGCSSGWAPGN